MSLSALEAGRPSFIGHKNVNIDGDSQAVITLQHSQRKRFTASQPMTTLRAERDPRWTSPRRHHHHKMFTQYFLLNPNIYST